MPDLRIPASKECPWELPHQLPRKNGCDQQTTKNTYRSKQSAESQLQDQPHQFRRKPKYPTQYLPVSER